MRFEISQTLFRFEIWNPFLCEGALIGVWHAEGVLHEGHSEDIKLVSRFKERGCTQSDKVPLF